MTPRPESITADQIASWSGSAIASGNEPDEAFFAGAWLENQLRGIGAPEQDIEAVGFANGQKSYHERDPWGTAIRSLAQYKSGEWDLPGFNLASRLIREHGFGPEKQDGPNSVEEFEKLTGMTIEQAIASLNEMAPEAGRASVAATVAFKKFMDDLPTQWRPGEKRWQGIRAWAVDEAGQARPVPAKPLPVPGCIADGDIVEKDLIIATVAKWARKNHPHALILASESWSYSMTDAQRKRMLARFGRSPDLMDEQNRNVLRREFGATVSESFLVHGELLGHLPCLRIFTIDGGSLVSKYAGNGGFNSIFDSILTGHPRERSVKI